MIKSKLYHEYLENPIDLIEPSKTSDVCKMFPTLIPTLDTYVDRIVTKWKDREFLSSGFWIIDYSEFMKEWNKLPENIKRKTWICTENNEWFFQIKGIV